MKVINLKVVFDLEVVSEKLTEKQVANAILSRIDFSEYLFQHQIDKRFENILIISKKAKKVIKNKL
jgi:hypothetical protein